MTQAHSYHPSSPDYGEQGSAPAGLRPGDKIDKYTITEQIGAGGMATVWKGHDPVLDRYVAIKEFSAASIQAQGQDLANRFRGEANLQKKLARNNPHLVHVYDFIDDDRGLFIIMEYVKGQSLEQFLSQTTGPVEQRQALGMVGATALALGTIHQHNVVHRDLKPSNILLPDDGGLKVSDFGIAAIVGDQEAMAVGSVRYMAPELFREEPVDGRADIYSLGMIAYEMLAGREKSNEAFKIVLRDQRNQALRWMKWHTNARAKAPPLSQVNPDIPPALSELVARMMEKDPQQRVASANELLEAMRRLFAGNQPQGQVKPESPARDVEAVASDNPTAALPKKSKLPYILAAVLLVQVAIGGAIFYKQHSDEQAKIAARENQARSSLNEAAEAYKSGQYQQAHDLYTAVSQAWDEPSQYHRAAQAGIFLTEARLDIDAGNYNDAIGKVEAARRFNIFKNETLDTLRQEAQSRSAFEGETKAIAALLDNNELAAADSRIKRFETGTQEEFEAMNELNARLTALQNKARDERTIADATRERQANGLDAGITFLQGQLAARPSQQVRQQLEAWQTERRYENLLAEARQLESQGKLAEAIEALDKAQAINETQGQGDQIRQLRIRSLLARAAQEEENNRKDQAVEIYTEILGLDKNQPQAKAALARIQVANRREVFLRAARTAMAKNQYDQAIQQYQNAIDISSDQEVRDSLRLARLAQALAQANLAMEENDLAAATRYARTAQNFSGDDQRAAQLLEQINTRREYLRYLNQADAMREQGKFADAQMLYLRAQRVSKTPEVEQRLDENEVQQLMAQARFYAEKKEWRTARAVLRTLLAKRELEEASVLLAKVSENLPPENEEQNAQTP